MVGLRGVDRNMAKEVKEEVEAVSEPQEGEMRTNKDGKEEICFGGEWMPLQREPTEKKSKSEVVGEPIESELKIGGLTLRCRATPLRYPNKKRKGYGLKILDDQPVYGGGNLFIRMKTESKEEGN